MGLNVVARLERRLSRLLVRRWYDWDRQPPRVLVVLWGGLLRLRGRLR